MNFLKGNIPDIYCINSEIMSTKNGYLTLDTKKTTKVYMYFSQLLNLFHTNFIKVRRCLQIIVSPVLNKFISLTDNFIKKTHTIFMNTYYEGIKNVWSKNRNISKERHLA